MSSANFAEIGATFLAASEQLHERFLEIRFDQDCDSCSSSAFGEAILTAWIQTEWGDFTRHLITASALGGRRRDGAILQPLPGVTEATDAERHVKGASKEVIAKRGLMTPVWHAPWFALDVSVLLGLSNHSVLEAALGPTNVPKQITTVRNVLVHPGRNTQEEYRRLQAKLGMLNVAPEFLPRQLLSPGVTLFTSWIRELQGAAHDSIA